MNACLTLEHRFDRTPDGSVWTRSNHHYEESRRYLGAFEHVRMLARIRDVSEPPPGAIRADGDGVSFAALPYYLGFEQFCLRWRAVQRAALRAIGDSDAVILKAPSTISCLIEPALRRSGRPFAIELLGDAWGVFSRGSVSHPLRPLIRRVFTWRTQAQCRHACAVRYVGGHLQERYPASANAFRVSVSDVNLPPVALAMAPRQAGDFASPLRLISIGSLEQRYKGIDVLLHAIRKCVDREFACRLVVLGEGRQRPALESLAARLAIQHLVEFKGMLPAGEPVLAAIDESDVFVMPSLQEGMPRAMIEAMARGLPCVGSAVGGIPELLDAEDLVPAGDPQKLADAIIAVGCSRARMEAMSRRCLDRAREFEQSRLAEPWRNFLGAVRDATDLWRRKDVRAPEAALVGGV